VSESETVNTLVFGAIESAFLKQIFLANASAVCFETGFWACPVIDFVPSYERGCVVWQGFASAAVRPASR